MNKLKFYFGHTKKKSKNTQPAEIQTQDKRLNNFSKKDYEYKKKGICPICQKEKDKLTTDHRGSVMCGACFINSL